MSPLASACGRSLETPVPGRSGDRPATHQPPPTLPHSSGGQETAAQHEETTAEHDETAAEHEETAAEHEETAAEHEETTAERNTAAEHNTAAERNSLFHAGPTGCSWPVS